eukprot:TRINITY_DN5769_c0_g2_i1.p1 TRINITY_DN5769_c0_g2~~TRINITY_DN5769_c0_g2_i1.p1  ORF type:complete len:314 (+),score=61.09 TRINITY_DN5769_c0_g2_i1:29-943(+)
MENEDDIVFESLQKSARKTARRGVRWSIRSGNTLRSDLSIQPTKRPHGLFTVLHREEEEAANGGANYSYRTPLGYAPGSRIRTGADNIATPNPNRSGPDTTVIYSLDKRKNWEHLETAKKESKQRRLAMSYSDTDDISDSGSDESEDDGELSVPKIVVVEHKSTFNDDPDPTITSLEKLKVADRFMDKSIVNHRIDENPDADDNDREAAELAKYRISKSRKGFVVRERRPKGKKGVKKATHHNRHASQIYDLAKADTLVVASPGAGVVDKYAREHSHLCDCRCSMCRSPKYDRAKAKKSLLDQL